MGISALVATALGSLGVGATTASVLAPVITQGALGAGMSAITGGDPLTGAITGGALGLFGVPDLGQKLGLSSGVSVLPGTQTVVGGMPVDKSGVGALHDFGSANVGAQNVPSSMSPSDLASSLDARSPSPQGGALGGLPQAAGKIAGGASDTSKILSALMLMGSRAGQQRPPQPDPGPYFNKPLNTTGYLNRTQTPVDQNQDWSTYGQRPEQSFFAGNQLQGFAGGGALSRTANNNVVSTDNGQNFVAGGGDGTSDSVPARLSNSEYILTAADVSRIGQGSSEAGAKKLDDMRVKLAKDAGAKLHQPRVKEPMQYLRAGGR